MMILLRLIVIAAHTITQTVKAEIIMLNIRNIRNVRKYLIDIKLEGEGNAYI